MPVPTVTERLTSLLASRYVDGDVENNAVLDAIIGGIADAADRLSLIAFGSDEVPPGHALTDPSVAPDWALAHAALYTGGILPGRSAAEPYEDWLARARSAAVYPAGIKRGTDEAVRRAVEPLLTGTKTVVISVAAGDPYQMVIRTITSETPSPAAVQAAIEGSYVSGGQRGALRAEQTLSYLVSDSPTFAEATLRFSDVPNGVTALNVTRDDVT